MAITGPDVSHWQGAVNFGAVRRAGHPFAILKASYGVGGIDPMFAADRAAAHAAGLVAGMYHFAGSIGADGLIRVGSAQAEAANYLNAVGSLQPGEFPVLDYEPTAPPANPVAWCADWLGWILGQTGVMPMIYINQSTRDRYDWSPVVALGAQLWLAKYDGSFTDNPGSPGRWPRVAMEQYTDIGTVPGVPGLCDVNVFYGSTSELAALGHNPTSEADLNDAQNATLNAIYAVLMRKQNGGVQDVLNTANATLNAVRALADPAQIAAEIVALLPTGTGNLSKADVIEALREFYGSLPNPTPAS